MDERIGTTAVAIEIICDTNGAELAAASNCAPITSRWQIITYITCTCTEKLHYGILMCITVLKIKLLLCTEWNNFEEEEEAEATDTLTHV